MSKKVTPITIELGVSDSLLVIEGLNALIRNKDRHELDRELARNLRERILRKVEDNAIEVGD
jgi:hypothetical protein